MCEKLRANIRTHTKNYAKPLQKNAGTLTKKKISMGLGEKSSLSRNLNFSLGQIQCSFLFALIIQINFYARVTSFPPSFGYSIRYTAIRRLSEIRIQPANKCEINVDCGFFQFLISSLQRDLETWRLKNAQLSIIITFFLVFNQRALLYLRISPGKKIVILNDDSGFLVFDQRGAP